MSEVEPRTFQETAAKMAYFLPEIAPRSDLGNFYFLDLDAKSRRYLLSYRPMRRGNSRQGPGEEGVDEVGKILGVE